MTIGTKETKIFTAVIISVSIDMVNRQHQWLAIPNRVQPTQSTAKRRTRFNQRPAQLIRPFRLRQRITQNKYLIGGGFSWPASMLVPLISYLAKKVVSVESIFLHQPFDIALRATRLFQSQPPQNFCIRERGGDEGLQSFCRVFAIRHIASSKGYFFSGAADGDAFGASFFGSSFCAGLAAGEAAALAEAAGEAEASGEAAGEVAAAGADAAGDGVGVGVSTGSPTTDRPPVTPGKENNSANSIKMIAATIVAFSNGFCAPRGPKAV
jgi:hypothetical protein